MDVVEEKRGEIPEFRKQEYWDQKSEELVGSVRRQLEEGETVAVSTLDVGQIYLELKGKASREKDILVWLMNNAPLALKNEEGQYLTLLDAEEENIHLDPADLGKYYGPEAFTSGKAARKAVESALLPVRSEKINLEKDIDNIFNLVLEKDREELAQKLGIPVPEKVAQDSLKEPA